MSIESMASFRLAQATVLPTTANASMQQLATWVNAALGARTLTVLTGGVVAVGATGILWNLEQLQQFHAALERGDYSERDLRAFSQRIDRSGGGFSGIMMRIEHPELDALLRPPQQPPVPSVAQLQAQLFGGQVGSAPNAPVATAPPAARPVDIAKRGSQASMARFAESLGAYRERLSDVRARGMQLIDAGRDTGGFIASVNRAIAAFDKLVDRVERLAALDGMRSVFGAMPGLPRLVDGSTAIAFTPASLASRIVKVEAEVRASARQFGLALRTAEQEVAKAERHVAASRGESTMAVAKGPGEMIDPERGRTLGPNAGVGNDSAVVLPPAHTVFPRAVTGETKGFTEFPAGNGTDPVGDQPRHTGNTHRQRSPFVESGTPRDTALGNGSLMRSESFSNAAAELWWEPAVAEARWLREGSDANLPRDIEKHIERRYGVSPAEARQVMKQALLDSNRDLEQMRALIRTLEKNHALSDSEIAQMQALDARLSANDARWVEPLIAVLVRGVVDGSFDTPERLNRAVGLSLMLSQRGYDFNAAADGSPRIVRRPPSTIAAMDPHLTDLSKRAGYHDSRPVLVAVVEGEFDVKHAGLVLRTNPDAANPIGHLGGELWTDHSAAVSSVITSRNMLTRIAPVPITLVPENETAALIKRSIRQGARVVNISVRPRSDAEADDWRNLALRHRDVIFTVAAGNDRVTEGDFNARMNRIRGSANVLIVANARGSAGLHHDSQGRGNATHAAVGTRVPVALGTSSGRFASGTSMSAPIVARVAAQMFAADPRLTGAQAVDILGLTVLDSQGLANAVGSGGLTNERAAVTLAALTGLRRQGIPLDASLRQLRLTGDSAAWFAQAVLEIVPYLPSIDSTEVTLRVMALKYDLGPTERALLERVVRTAGQPPPNGIRDAANDIGLAGDDEAVTSLLQRLGVAPAQTPGAFDGWTRVDTSYGRAGSDDVAGTVRRMFERERVRATSVRDLSGQAPSAGE